jgi:hypothetical protein
MFYLFSRCQIYQFFLTLTVLMRLLRIVDDLSVVVMRCLLISLGLVQVFCPLLGCDAASFQTLAEPIEDQTGVVVIRLWAWKSCYMLSHQ